MPLAVVCTTNFLGCISHLGTWKLFFFPSKPPTGDEGPPKLVADLQTHGLTTCSLPTGGLGPYVQASNRMVQVTRLNEQISSPLGAV